ncbi:MAG TPA: Trm112 family protein [Thermoanaerobaculia bacterium]|nr:Trm112 family protein [Thermoanaerobaculia bacterium]HUM29273.1 Trm112 family protein [Thermoanaerobaculia bacterium]HXK67769.1 Trm112 family protein [Thermoanaerobaculia bacterium]
MSLDADFLEILACPACKVGLELLPLPESLCQQLIERYRPRFRDEEPVVEQGLRCSRCRKVYPVVSDIPVLLIEDAVELPPETP